ncbi:hypothetical protein E3P77_01835 [Wallemia ichthyophaga]|uniref:Uncharacterized protein n=2 Tax=Wallemia ichthyophaga TaxID=245174 RepID=A0A4T0HD36_WALIC|nr:hypothetical protein E3P97_02230 [Wallemia ichthyophaga]TIB00012.1 hypothetical protein E3P95_01855 [Wallemia ichthyophaga]TIB01259.1 hypothetical protein E3P94_01887 [Wallemia ichthyophaga]TIB12334.1 hypothetical protein E3P90_02084 [Wallemia ichthyophaga]TIB13588.1 hypothetical protein E3P93_01921 [Wallemia ichthyophaga]
MNIFATLTMTVLGILPATHALADAPVQSLLDQLSSLSNYSPSSIHPSRYIHSSYNPVDSPNDYDLLADGLVELLDDSELLADLVFRAPPPFTHNTQHAFQLYKSLANNASATAHSILAFLYDTGYNSVVDPHPGLALLHYTFAALAGHTPAEMALAYKHSIGDGAELSCDQAVEWYSRVADKAMDYYLSGPPGGHALPLSKPKLSDLKGGPYGLGASAASTGENAYRPVIYAGKARDSGENWHDLIDYFSFAANQGDLQYAVRLGNIYYHGSVYTPKFGPADGSGAIPKDFNKAKYWFTRATRKIWHDGLQSDKQREATKYTRHLVSIASNALGRMYLRGEGDAGTADYSKAYKWFNRARDLQSAEAVYYLGLMYKHGYYVDSNEDTATMHFSSAASSGYPEAYVELGNGLLARGDTENAIQHYEWAVNLSASFEGTYRLATLTRHHDCASALARFKSVSERGDWLTGDKLWQEATQRWALSSDWHRESYGRHEAEAALLAWWRLAEMGYESAQNNVAYILDQDTQRVRLTSFGFDPPVNHTLAFISLRYWEKSAAQHTLDSRIKAADYHFKGLGTPADPARAAELYLAADTSSLALWNVGWMYETGQGLPSDLNLAKRYYDQALETNAQAAVPVLLSLAHLYLKSLWQWVRSGDDNNLLSHFSGGGEAQDDAGASADGRSAREREEDRDRSDAREAVNRVDWMAYGAGDQGAHVPHGHLGFVDGLLQRSSPPDGHHHHDSSQSITFVVVIGTLVALLYLRQYIMGRLRQRAVDRLTAEITRRAHEHAGHTAARGQTQASEQVQAEVRQQQEQPEQEVRHRNNARRDDHDHNDDT